MRWIVWTRRQALTRLAALLLTTVAATVGAMYAYGSGAGQEMEEEAVAAFAAGSLFGISEESTEQPTEAPSPAPAPTEAEPSPAPIADRSLHVEVIRDTPAPKREKTVLIYHTHTWEAYAQVEDAPYVETEKWRTKDNSANVVAVGDALTAALQAMGYQVVHDDTAFEPPKLSDAYTRSLMMLEERVQRGESYDLYIDLHRDAYVKNSGVEQTVNIGGEPVARLMLLIGKGTSASYAVKPDWEANYAIAEALMGYLNDMQTGLCRRISLKNGRFNQQIAPRCILVECGNNMNTLEEVLRSIPYLAQAIDQYFEAQEE